MKKLLQKTLTAWSPPALLIVSLLIQGCSPNTFLSGETTAGATQGPVSIQQANDLLRQGKKREAAQAYYNSAAQYPSPQKERIILQAAEIAASTGDSGLTNTYLAKIPASDLTGENRGRHAYVRALLALQNKNPSLALRTLPNNLDGLSPGLRQKVQHIRQRAQAMARTDGNANVQHAMIPAAANRIAVLLPQTGSLGKVSQDIYQGIQAARDSLASDVSVQLYDVNSGGPAAQYQKAVADGADIIVGPLDKGSLAQLLAQPRILTKPLLSLNYLTSSNNIPAALYQFGLLPEDEAKQVAEFAIARGQRTAVILKPESSWGNRVADAFRQSYQAKGGQVLVIQGYPNTPSNAYMANAQSAISHAENRASMIFLAASPSQARLMKPLLSAQAGNIPVYATSHIFSGRPDPAQDADLDGIIYTEIPWIMEGMQTGVLNTASYPRMFALGMDAFLIAKNLPSIARNPNARVNGKTGNISLASNRQVQRKLPMATFQNGLPRPLGQ